MMKIPIISTVSNTNSEVTNGNEAGYMKWRGPQNDASSRIFNEILKKQDWYEIVVLYDGM